MDIFITVIYSDGTPTSDVVTNRIGETQEAVTRLARPNAGNHLADCWYVRFNLTAWDKDDLLLMPAPFARNLCDRDFVMRFECIHDLMEVLRMMTEDYERGKSRIEGIRLKQEGMVENMCYTPWDILQYVKEENPKLEGFRVWEVTRKQKLELDHIHISYSSRNDDVMDYVSNDDYDCALTAAERNSTLR